MGSPKSSKAKGRKLQNMVRDALRDAFPSLEEDDIKSQTMGMTGEDIVLSPAARKLIPYSFECKNVERLQFWSSVEQCEVNCKEELTPVLIVKKNRKDPYACIPIETFITMIRKLYDKSRVDKD
tara:strand:+ start:464 stop:835 length:372 start_codon:yes stop_codon:yes gene_type:complete